MNLQTRFGTCKPGLGLANQVLRQSLVFQAYSLEKDRGAPWLGGAPLVRALSIKAASRLYGMVVLQNKYFTLYPFSMVGGCALPHAS
jgi:hypothetical protein